MSGEEMPVVASGQNPTLAFVYVNESGSRAENIGIFIPALTFNDYPHYSYDKRLDVDLTETERQIVKNVYGDLLVEWDYLVAKYEDDFEKFSDENLEDIKITELLSGSLRADLKADYILIRDHLARWGVAINWLHDKEGIPGITGDDIVNMAEFDMDSTNLDKVNVGFAVLGHMETMFRSIFAGSINLESIGMGDQCFALVVDTISLDGEVGDKVAQLNLANNSLTIEGLRYVLTHLDKRDTNGDRIHGLGVSVIDVSGNQITNDEIEALKEEFPDLLSGFFGADISIFNDPTLGEMGELIDHVGDDMDEAFSYK